MTKFIYLIFIALFFNACTSTNYNSIANYIDMKKENKQFTNNSCTFNAYTTNSTSKEYGNIFIEHIALTPTCKWNGFQRSYFDDLFKQKTNIKTMVALERIDFQNMEFSTYLINDKYIMNLIYDFSSSSDTFIIDYKGVLFNKMIKNFDKNYINKYIDKPRFSSNYNASLAKQNIIEHYFTEEMELMD